MPIEHFVLSFRVTFCPTSPSYYTATCQFSRVCDATYTLHFCTAFFDLSMRFCYACVVYVVVTLACVFLLLRFFITIDCVFYIFFGSMPYLSPAPIFLGDDCTTRGKMGAGRASQQHVGGGPPRIFALFSHFFACCSLHISFLLFSFSPSISFFLKKKAKNASTRAF